MHRATRCVAAHQAEAFLVSGRVQLDAQAGQAPAGLGPYPIVMLTDAAREDNLVNATQCNAHGAELLGDPVAEHVDSQPDFAV